MPNISPFISTLESFHPKIQYELTRRRVSSETVNVYMPFVKLTSLTNVLGENLQEGSGEAYCPSLGIHGQPSVTFDDIFLPQGNKSIVGYAIADNGDSSIPVIVADASKDQQNIPIPGIVELNTERSTAGPMGVRGGLLKADFKIRAYSVGQVDTLLRYFLRPATRVVMEMGRMSSNSNQNTPLTEKPIKPYNWNKPKTDIILEFNDLIVNPTRQKQFIENYIYANYGNYEIFIGYVVKFNLKYTKENIYEIDLTVHSVQQFEVPTKHTAIQSTCANAVGPNGECKAIDVQDYFSVTSAWKSNSFNSLLAKYVRDSEWRQHIVEIKNTDANPRNNGSTSTQAGTRENEYYVSWKFFVEKLLNDTESGIASMLRQPDTIALALLRAGSTEEPDPTDPSAKKSILVANQVGYHPYLRSNNPGVMLIYNKTAQDAFDASPDKRALTSAQSAAKREERLNEQYVAAQTGVPEARRVNQNNANTLMGKIKRSTAVGQFSNVLDQDNKPGASYLTRGVWLHTQAIKQAFTSNDTISSAINALLTMMNTATEGYWNLQLYSTDREVPGLHVVDMGLSKTPSIISTAGTSTQQTNSLLYIDKEEAETSNVLDSITKVNEQRYTSTINSNEPQYLYMFNRGTKRFTDGDLGSDLIDLNVEFNLPQVIAVQAIANVGGPAQKSTLQSIGIKQLQEISLVKNLFAPCDTGSLCREDRCRTDARGSIGSLQDQIKELDSDTRDLVTQVNSPQTPADQKQPLSDQIAENEKNKEILRLQITQAQSAAALGNNNLTSILREYGSLGTAIELVELNTSRMLKQINRDSTNAEDSRPVPPAHAFNSSNLTKTVVDVTLPGIGGIGLFQAFVVDRVPSILDRGYYVVTKVAHQFSSQNGWTSKIQGRFRYRPIPTPASGNPDPCANPTQAPPPPPPPTSTPRAIPSTATRTAPSSTGTPPQTRVTRNSGTKPVGEFTNTEIVNRTNRILALTEEPRFGSIATKEAYQRRVASGEVAALQNELRIIDDEARRRVIAGRGQLPTEFRGSYSRNLENRLRERNLRLRF